MIATTLPAPPPAVTCGCGREYDAESFAALPFVGVWDTGEEGTFLALHNCACGSTRAIEVPRVA